MTITDKFGPNMEGVEGNENWSSVLLCVSKPRNAAQSYLVVSPIVLLSGSSLLS